MGCICSKGISANDYVENRVRDKELNKSSKKFLSFKRDDVASQEVNGGGSNEATARLISTQPIEENAGSTPTFWGEGGKEETVVEKLTTVQLQNRAIVEVGANGGQSQFTRILTMPNGIEAAQVAAGWPSWLTAVAGEAIKGWVPRKADSFEKLDKIGQGTYSSVYRARDLETGKLVAMKKVRFVNMDPESVRFMAREIHILRRLDHPNVMKLEGLVTSRVSGSLYLIFEYMDHDLAGLVARPTVKFTEAQIKCYMQQLLRGLEHCHSHGVLHRDIKGSNLLIDNDGNLKIGDFGLATFFSPKQKQPLTSRVVTLWYRPPELLLGATDYGVAVDLWSTGCILAELFASKPIMPGRTEVEQLHKIFKLCGSPSEEYWKKSKLPHATIFKPQHPYKRCVADTFKDFPSSTLALLDVLLAVQPDERGSASSALQSEFFTVQPLPCDPSSLPKYPPSKEFDAKRRDEEARRRREASGKGRGHEVVREGPKESKAVPAPDFNAELQASIQKRKGHPDPKSKSEKYNPEEEGGNGFPIEPPKGTSQNGLSHSGQIFSSSRSMKVNEETALIGDDARAFESSKSNAVELRMERPYIPQRAAAQLSRLSSSIMVRGSSRFNNGRETSENSHWHGESSEKHEWSHHLLERPKSSNRKSEPDFEKESTTSYAPKKDRIHYSGPLLPSGGNIEEMLKEHEKQIQRAVRNSRLDKAKTKKSRSGQSESLLHHHEKIGTS